MSDLEGSVGVEAPIESSIGEEVVDTSLDTGASVQPDTESVNDLDTSGQKSELTEKTLQKGKLDVANFAKTNQQALKALDPRLPGALFELGGLHKEFPGGLREAVALKSAISEYGGVAGLKESAEALADYGSLEGLFEKGDGSFMERLADASPEAFSQVMPSGLSKWKAVDPDGYNHTQAKVATATLDGMSISQTLEQVWAALPDGAAKNAVQKMWMDLDGLRKLGDQAPERKVDPKNEALTRKEQELAERESRVFLAPIATEGKQQISSITDREMNASYQWNATDPSVKEAVSERVRKEVVGASQKDKGFQREFDRLKERGDAAGLSRHVKNFQERVTPGIVQRVAKLFAVKPKGAGAPVKKGPIAAVQNGKPAAQGWVRVAGQPTASQIDRSKTTADLILDNKAVLKDGRQVQWA